MRSSVMLEALSEATPLRSGLIQFCFRHGSDAVREAIVHRIETRASVVGRLSPAERLELLLERLPASAVRGESWVYFADHFRQALCYILSYPALDTDRNLERLFAVLGAGVDDGTIPYFVADTMLLEHLDIDLRTRVRRLRITSDLCGILDALPA